MTIDTLNPLFNLNKFSEKELQQSMANHGKVISVNKGDTIIREGDLLNFMPIVLSGSIRVYQQKEDREILLYYVRAGETCMMSLSSAYFNMKSAANGIAMENSEILVIPTYLISDWQLRYPSWNQYIIHTFRSRYDELLNIFGSVAFDPIANRIREYLRKVSHQEKSTRIKCSHQAIANELGTSRVVVSRILKQLEKEKKLKIKRGEIELLQI